MGISVERRIKEAKKKKIYWVTDLVGRYGISFRISANFAKIDDLPKLRGILLQKNNVDVDKGVLNIVLNNKDEWDLFLALCRNLVSVAVEYDSDEASISAVEVRLNRWQELLKKERARDLSIEQQMGLYAELKCLRDIVAPKIGFKNAITSWVGIEFDRQDFLLDDVAIEVKSHKTSKGEIIQVSSKYQLDPIKAKLVLISYSLTFSENGETVQDVIEDVRKQLKSEDAKIAELYERKLIECDFIPELLTLSLQGFTIDSQKSYLVTDDFPRIESQKISPFIEKVNYSIELTHCKRFEIEEDQII